MFVFLESFQNFKKCSRFQILLTNSETFVVFHFLFGFYKKNCVFRIFLKFQKMFKIKLFLFFVKNVQNFKRCLHLLKNKLCILRHHTFIKFSSCIRNKAYNVSKNVYCVFQISSCIYKNNHAF